MCSTFRAVTASRRSAPATSRRQRRNRTATWWRIPTAGGTRIRRRDAMDRLLAADVIRLLGLTPHPEGGHYRETFRDPRLIDGRSASTAIYFLLARGDRSHWHRVDAVEV